MNDPTYQQMMIQQLMGGGQMPPGMNGQAPSTPQGAGFITGNGMAMMPGQSGGMLGTPPPSQQMMQPMATYPGAATAQTGQMY